MQIRDYRQRARLWRQRAQEALIARAKASCLEIADHYERLADEHDAREKPPDEPESDGLGGGDRA